MEIRNVENGTPYQLGPYYALRAIWLRAGKRHVIALAVETDDEHWASVAIACRLVGCQQGSVPAFRCCITDALAEAAMAKLVGAAKKFDGIIRVVRSQYGFHGAIVLIAKGQDVRPHAK